jgi:FeS assembly protein IscX
MISPVELARIVAEWRVRLQRAREILQPPTWSEKEWKQFSQALALMVRDHGRSWIIDPKVYWDLRWNLQDGGELVCQIEHTPGEKTSLVVAQNGGFAQAAGSYTWLWAEFNIEGDFARDPYWVDGTWKDALTAFLLPLERQTNYLLAGRAQTPDSLLLQEGARPNDGVALLPGITSSDEQPAYAELTGQKNGVDEYAVNGNGKHAPESNGTPEAAVEIEAAAVATEVTEEVPVEPAPTEPTPVASAPTEPVPENPVAEKPAESAAELPAESATPRVDTPAPFSIHWGMPQKLTWKDTDEIAYALIDNHPDTDPLKLSFPKLHKLITELEDFGDDPEKSSESILESIQMAWYEEVK